MLSDRRSFESAPRIGFAGAGAVACALAPCASRAGFDIAGFLSLTRSSSARAARKISKKAGEDRPRIFKDVSALADASNIIMIATPDRAIDGLDAELCKYIRSGSLVCHLSGALGPGALSRCRARGAKTASLHLLQTFPDRDSGEDRIPGTFAAIDGDAAAARFLMKFAKKLKMRPLILKNTDRALYHASAVMASNFVVVLYDWAVDTFARSTGQPRAVAAEALWPLFAAASDNIKKIGLPGALSGPVARGDFETVARHLSKFITKDERDLYGALSLRAAAMAVAKKSIPASGLQQMSGVVARASRKRR